MTRVVLAVAALLQVTAVITLLRPPPPQQPAVMAQLIARLDADGDGVLSTEEAAARSLPGQPSWDLDGDKKIAPAELEAMLWALDPNALYESATGR